MGGVDLFDMLLALYKCDHKSKKWYRRIFLWSLNVAVVNGWLYFTSDIVNSWVLRYLSSTTYSSSRLLSVNHFSWITNCLQACLLRDVDDRVGPSRQPQFSLQQLELDEETSDLLMKKTRRVLTVNETSRFDLIGHLPVHSEPKQRCKLCRQYVRMKCLKCNCHLCATKERNCYIKYHTNDSAL
jgi:hypothetical protein